MRVSSRFSLSVESASVYRHKRRKNTNLRTPSKELCRFGRNLFSKSPESLCKQSSTMIPFISPSSWLRWLPERWRKISCVVWTLVKLKPSREDDTPPCSYPSKTWTSLSGNEIRYLTKVRTYTGLYVSQKQLSTTRKEKYWISSHAPSNLLASSPACLPVPRILSTSGDKQRIRLLDLGYNAPFLLGRIGTITIIINFCNPPPFRNRRSGFMCQMDTDEGFEPKNYFSNNHHD